MAARDAARLTAGDTTRVAAGGADMAGVAASGDDLARLPAGDTARVAASGADMAGVATGAGASSADLAGIAAGNGENTPGPPFSYLRVIWFMIRGDWTAIFDVEIEFIGFAGRFRRRTHPFENGDRVDRVSGPPPVHRQPA
jgi:hypothetical protein